jgi:acyl-CoA hydrolase
MKFENHKVVKPEDLNHYGFLFGGKLLQWVDEYSWIAASLEFPNHNFVTKSMDKIEFRKSVRSGAIINFQISKAVQGKAFVKYEVKVFAKHTTENNNELVFNTTVTFVSVDKNGKIKPLK